MNEMAISVLIASNVTLMFSAMRKSNIIENYEREVRELKAKNDRLAGAVDALWRDDDV